MYCTPFDISAHHHTRTTSTDNMGQNRGFVTEDSWYKMAKSKVQIIVLANNICKMNLVEENAFSTTVNLAEHYLWLCFHLTRQNYWLSKQAGHLAERGWECT